MTVLAYDPEQLASLLIQMTAAIEERRRLSSSDPAAAEALRVVRSALAAIEQVWSPLVRRLLTTDPLAGRVPQTLGDITLLRLDVAGVQALVQVIAGTNPDDLLHDERALTLLADEMALISARPDLVRALLADIDEMPAYVAAVLVSHLDLHGTQLAEAADAILMRWWSEVLSMETGIENITDRFPADVLFPLIAADPIACVRYVELAGAHPSTLFESTTQPELAHRIAYTGTSPAYVDPATAGRLLVPLLDWYADEWYPMPGGWLIHDPGLATCFVDLLAPWTLQMSPLNHDWQLTADHQRHLLDALLHDGAALERFIANGEQLQAAVLRATATDDEALLTQLAAYAGMLAELIIQRRYDDEQVQAEAWGLLITITATIISLPLNPAANIGVAAASTALDSFLPFDPEEAAADEFYAQSYAFTVTVALIAHELYRQWLASRSIPPTTPPPPVPDPTWEHPYAEYCELLLAWKQHLPGGDDGKFADQFDTAIYPWLAGNRAGEDVVRT